MYILKIFEQLLKYIYKILKLVKIILLSISLVKSYCCIGYNWY